MTDGSATAFVPGHVTAFFSPELDDDPTKAGARGAGITLSDGVTVRVAPGQGLELDGEPVSVEAVDTVRSALRIEARIEATTKLPLGAGFGVSGALALGTAIAANRAFDLRLSANELVTIAHGAEVRAGTGLGDVVAQAQGGIPIRLEPGAPPHGLLDGVSDRGRVEYITFGELSTEAILDDGTDHLAAAGRRALSWVVDEPTLPTLLRAGRGFARETDLLTDRVYQAIEAVSEAGGEASMAMLGETVVALETGLSEAGFEPSSCAIHQPGAIIEE